MNKNNQHPGFSGIAFIGIVAAVVAVVIMFGLSIKSKKTTISEQTQAISETVQEEATTNVPVSTKTQETAPQDTKQAVKTYNFNGRFLTYPENWKVVETKNGEGAGLNYNINFTPPDSSKGVRLIVHSSYEATTCNNNYRDAEGKLVQCFDVPIGGVLLAEATDAKTFAVYESLVTQLFQ